jgi:hypothetical protein
MAVSKFESEGAYKKLMREMEMKPRSYEEIASDWEAKSEEWYHAMITIEDLSIVLAIPNLKIYAWCRCKVVTDDGSEGHFHWHALVHFAGIKKESWRRKATRRGIKFSSRKNTFKNIFCLDHAVGVLRYIGCGEGQRVGRRGNDGLCTHPHTHYARQPIEEQHCHSRGKRCGEVRDEISNSVAFFMDLKEKANWSALALHNFEECLCARGKMGKEKARVANEKRRAYYKTAAGIEMKKTYREKATLKRQLINHLTASTVSTKAVLCQDTIKNLLKLL